MGKATAHLGDPVETPAGAAAWTWRPARWIGLEARRTLVAAWRAAVALVLGDDLTYAAAIAYYGLLSLFPFLLLLISLLGTVTADEGDRTTVLSFALRYFPTRMDFVATQLDAFREARVPIGLTGALALLWSSLGVFGAITAAVNQAWGVEHRRSFLTHRLVSFLMLAAAGGVMVVALLLVGAAQMAQASWFGELLYGFAAVRALQALALSSLPNLLAIVAAGLVFYFVPNAPIRFRDVWLGALLTGALWRLAFEVLSWFVRTNTSLTLLNGSVTAVVVFLLWVYVSAVIFVYGVRFTVAHTQERSSRQLGAVPA